MFRMDDTIVAISTAGGAAARAIVRLSGPEAFRLAASAFTPLAGTLAERPGFRAADGLARFGRPPIELPARAYIFRAPRSYTRQDVVELHLPGSPIAAGALVSAVIDAGARQAAPGEFTARAFFHGRIDLSQAEAVADVIHAADDAQLRAALAALGGRISRLARQASERLADALATVEASIDLAEEDLRLAAPRDLAAALSAEADRLRRLAERAADLPESADQPRVVLAGRPNVGKSSLLNALTGEDRAIVSAMAGTTRDVLSAPLVLAGGAAVLQDAAGFAQAASGLALAADHAARRAVQRADVICFVVDAAAGPAHQDAELLARIAAVNAHAPRLVLANKADLLAVADRGLPTAGSSPQQAAGPPIFPRAARSPAAPPVLATSAVTGLGLDELRRRLAELLHLSAGRSGEALGLHRRQKRRLLAAADAARSAAELLAPAGEVADVAELAAVELRIALAELAAVSPDSPQCVSDDILGLIFGRFCVGK